MLPNHISPHGVVSNNDKVRPSCRLPQWATSTTGGDTALAKHRISFRFRSSLTKSIEKFIREALCPRTGLRQANALPSRNVSLTGSRGWLPLKTGLSTAMSGLLFWTAPTFCSAASLTDRSDLSRLADPFLVTIAGLYLLGLGLLALCDWAAMRRAEGYHWELMEAETRAERRGAKAVHDTLRNGLVRS